MLAGRYRDFVTAAPTLSGDCLGWARTAGYECVLDALPGTAVLRPEAGGETRFWFDGGVAISSS
jgi:hypothetical protein